MVSILYIFSSFDRSIETILRLRKDLKMHQIHLVKFLPCLGLSSLSFPPRPPNLSLPRPPRSHPRRSPRPLNLRSSLGPGLASLPRSLGSLVLYPSGLHPLESRLNPARCPFPLNPRPRSCPRPRPLKGGGRTGSLVASRYCDGGLSAAAASRCANSSLAALMDCLL